MCWCNPNIRTPQCKSINCIPPAPVIESPFNTPQTDMFNKETAIELLKKAGVLDENGKLKGTYKS